MEFIDHLIDYPINCASLRPLLGCCNEQADAGLRCRALYLYSMLLVRKFEKKNLFLFFFCFTEDNMRVIVSCLIGLILVHIESIDAGNII